MDKVAFITNATQYAGPPTVAKLTGQGWAVFCNDESFINPSARAAFEAERSGQFASAALDEAGFIAEGLARFGKIDALISNDVPKGTPPISEATDMLADFEQYADALLLSSVRLLRAALPAMKSARAGSVVFITSGAPLRNPTMGGPHGYFVARAGANALVRSLAPELAPFNIQINAVAPFFVYSASFFPSELGADDPKYRPLVDQMVPMKRFGQPEEIGRLIAQLASGEIGFVSGQVIAFSGGGC